MNHCFFDQKKQYNPDYNNKNIKNMHTFIKKLFINRLIINLVNI